MGEIEIEAVEKRSSREFANDLLEDLGLELATLRRI
jgi:hypothetical protein